ncbi:hypothetical protein L9F63_010942, partial [Diploptera punctata]
GYFEPDWRRPMIEDSLRWRVDNYVLHLGCKTTSRFDTTYAKRAACSLTIDYNVRSPRVWLQSAAICRRSVTSQRKGSPVVELPPLPKSLKRPKPKIWTRNSRIPVSNVALASYLYICKTIITYVTPIKTSIKFDYNKVLNKHKI